MENLKINKCWISNEKSDNPGAITWMKMEINSDGEVLNQEFILHIRVEEPDYATTKSWLQAIGRL
jgi:hypothetical protein